MLKILKDDQPLFEPTLHRLSAGVFRRQISKTFIMDDGAINMPLLFKVNVFGFHILLSP